MRLGERHEALRQGLGRFGRRGRSAQCLDGDRLNRRERVLHSVIELVDQQPSLLFGPFALRDVQAYRDRADDPPLFVPQPSRAREKCPVPPVAENIGVLLFVDCLPAHGAVERHLVRPENLPVPHHTHMFQVRTAYRVALAFR